MINDTYWFKLLNHYNKKGYINNGLTLPFIIGSRSVIEPKKDLQTINGFFQDVENSKIYISILKCDTIGEYVFNISKQFDFKIYGGFKNIVDIDGLFNDYKSLKDFSDYLTEIHMKHLNKNVYSKNEFGKWEGFSVNLDLPRLKELC